MWATRIEGVRLALFFLNRKRMNSTITIHTTHYQRIVNALFETIRLMAEIGRVIKTLGDWLGAYQASAGEIAK